MCINVYHIYIYIYIYSYIGESTSGTRVGGRRVQPRGGPSEEVLSRWHAIRLQYNTIIIQYYILGRYNGNT